MAVTRAKDARYSSLHVTYFAVARNIVYKSNTREKIIIIIIMIMMIIKKKLTGKKSPAYLSNRPQVSMVYQLIDHAGCW